MSLGRSSGWEWRVFWQVGGGETSVRQRLSRPRPDWAASVCRTLASALGPEFYPSAAEIRDDTYVDLREPSIGLKVRNSGTRSQLVELKLRLLESGTGEVTALPGLELWDKVLAVKSEFLRPDGSVASDDIARQVLHEKHANVLRMFEAAPKHPGKSVPIAKVRVQCVGAGVKIEAAEIHISRLGNTAEAQMWRSVCVEGPQMKAVRACVLNSAFDDAWQRERRKDVDQQGPNSAQGAFYGGYPEFVAAFPR